MSWGNGSGNEQRRQRKIPDVGRGMLRKRDKKQPNSPDFGGLLNCDGHLVDLAIWYMPARTNEQGQQLPESWGVRCSTFDPNAQQQSWQTQAPPAQAQPQAQWGQQQPLPYAQPAPGPQYAPGPQPPQHGGYAPAPGYTPPPPPQPQPQAPRPAWGGQTQQGQPGPHPGGPQPQGAASPQGQSGYRPNDVPF